MRRGLSLAIGALLLLLGEAGGAISDTREYRFRAVDVNDPAHAAAGEEYLEMRASPSNAPNHDVDLSFSVDGASPVPLSITRIVIEDPLVTIEFEDLLHVETAAGDSVRFERDPNPPGPARDFSYSASGPQGPVHHGLQPGELPLVLLVPVDPDRRDGEYQGLEIFSKALDQEYGYIAVELTVEGFPDGGTETFALDGRVPEPASGGLVALGTLALALRGRRERGR